MAINFDILNQKTIPAPQIVGQVSSGSGGGEGDDIMNGIQGLLGGIAGMMGGGGGGCGPGGCEPGMPAMPTGGGTGPVAQAVSAPINVEAPKFQPVTNLAQNTMPGVNMRINPEFGQKLPAVINDLKQMGYQPMIASGARTHAEQAEKVAKGYSKTMNSNHIPGNAVDIIDRRYGWNDKKFGKEIGQFAKDLNTVAMKHGLQTGINWKSFGPNGDFAHVQFTPRQKANTMNPNSAAFRTGNAGISGSAGRIPINRSNEYINSAREGARKVYADNPIMSDVATAQAILESNLANKPSGLARQNNFFGIKGSGTAGSVNMATREFVKGRMIGTNAGFAKNATPEDSFKQHQALMDRPRYRSVKNAKSFDEAAYALQKSGYATDPNYAKKLIDIKNRYLSDGTVTPNPMVGQPINQTMNQNPMQMLGLPSPRMDMIPNTVRPPIRIPLAMNTRQNLPPNMNTPMNPNVPIRTLTPEQIQEIMGYSGRSPLANLSNMGQGFNGSSFV